MEVWVLGYIEKRLEIYGKTSSEGTFSLVAYCVGVQSAACVFAIQAQDMTSQVLYLRYSACDIILETKVTFMMESKTGFEISTKVICQRSLQGAARRHDTAFCCCNEVRWYVRKASTLRCPVRS